MKRLSHLIGVATLAAVATAGPAMAADRQPYHTLHVDESVLALDNGQVFPSPEQPLDCPEWAEWLFFSNGTGRMHHLGRFDMTLTQCSHFPAGFPPFGYSEGTTTLTAANGDMLVLEHDLAWAVIFNDAFDFDGFEGTGSWSVEYGTGRFASATGDGSISVIGDIPTDDTPVGDLPDGATLWTLTGEIEYRASDRSGK